MFQKMQPALRRALNSNWNIALAVLLTILFIFLTVRASDEYRWSDWGFGDAQTMLSLRQWDEGGWFRNYFLFKPQGYAKVVDAFDDPNLRHHAHGTCPGSSPRVGPRLLYTHYPAGYLVPYALLFRAGLDGLFTARLLSIIFSLAALAFMYVLFSRITNPAVSFISVVFYGLSPAFLGYADSLANQPLDDLLRFGFMLAVVMSTRAASDLVQKRWMIAAWIMEFVLSLSSFDSVFFIYAWLVGWDLLERKGFRWKRYLIFSLAPISAHGLQFFQNVWYLGFDDAVIDIKDAFLLKHGADANYNFGQNRFDVILASIGILFNNLYSPPLLPALVIGLYLLYAFFLRDSGDQDMPSWLLLAVLFVCGLAFVIVLPHAARMPYEARQMAPFAALAAGGFSWSIIREFKRGIHGPRSGAEDHPNRIWYALPYVLLSAVLALVFWYSFSFLGRDPVYDVSRAMPDITLARNIKKIDTRYEPVLFDVGGFRIFWDPNYVPGYPQILPITEYYSGSSPILCFNDAERAARDLIYLVRLGQYRFSPLLVASDQQNIQDTLSLLLQEGILRDIPLNTYLIENQYVLDLTDYLNWEAP